MSHVNQTVEKGKIGETYHPSTNELISLKSLTKIICKKLNADYRKSIVLRKNKTTQDKYYRIFSKKELEKLNFKNKFININYGVLRTIKWIEANWKKFKNYNLVYQHRK